MRLQSVTTQGPQQTLKHDQHQYRTTVTGTKLTKELLRHLTRASFNKKKISNHKFLLENWFLV